MRKALGMQTEPNQTIGTVLIYGLPPTTTEDPRFTRGIRSKIRELFGLEADNSVLNCHAVARNNPDIEDGACDAVTVAINLHGNVPRIPTNEDVGSQLVGQIRRKFRLCGIMVTIQTDKKRMAACSPKKAQRPDQGYGPCPICGYTLVLCGESIRTCPNCGNAA